jgi:dihydroorotate dehydrogenase (fumarate)
MSDLSTTYMGLKLPSPLVVASSSISNKVENFQSAEASGAGAIVLRSLFEEQIEAAETELQEAIAFQADANPEARSYLPPQRIGPREYLRLLEKAKRSVRIPVIASLNAAAPGSWS